MFNFNLRSRARIEPRAHPHADARLPAPASKQRRVVLRIGEQRLEARIVAPVLEDGQDTQLVDVGLTRDLQQGFQLGDRAILLPDDGADLGRHVTGVDPPEPIDARKFARLRQDLLRRPRIAAVGALKEDRDSPRARTG